MSVPPITIAMGSSQLSDGGDLASHPGDNKL
jgi:hypothetical protein